MSELDRLLSVLDMRSTGPNSFEAHSVSFGGPTAFGGQILAQAVVAAASVDPDKDVRSLHTVFARGAKVDAPITVGVDVVQAGRTFASASVTFQQNGKSCARSLVLLSSREPDFIHHQPDAPLLHPPADATDSMHGPDIWEVKMEPGVDLTDPAEVGPAQSTAWARFPGAPDDQTIARALVAFATDGFLIGTAMRPHEGIGQSMAHVTINTTVVTHTLSFHEDVDAGDWLTMRMSSPNASHGCSYGRGEVFDTHGHHVASFVQENMIRPMPPARQ